MRVSIDVGGGRRYAYETDGLKVEIGDRVLLPGNWLHRDPFAGTVAALESDYDGPCARIISKLREGESNVR